MIKKTPKSKPKPKLKPKGVPKRKIGKASRVKKGRKKSTKKTELTKAELNPIIFPVKENDWESWQTFNPAAILLKDSEKLRGKADRIHFLYRAIGPDGISRLGYANSLDGLKINERLSYSVYEHRRGHFILNFYSFASGGSFGGAEDPRLVRVGEEKTLYMTYTACDEGLRVGLTSIKVKDFLNKNWKWKPAVLISPPGQTHKNWVIFPDKIKGKYAILHSINPQVGVAYFDNLEFDGETHIQSDYNGKCEPQSGCAWESYMRGVGAPPIKTKYGWLVFYHALEKNDSGKYKAGAMLLDLNNPTKILYRSKKPILEPDEAYENEGFKPGIVYISGAVVKDGKLLIYYGGADSYVNLAYADLEEFLQNLAQNQKPKWKGINRKIKAPK